MTGAHADCWQASIARGPAASQQARTPRPRPHAANNYKPGPRNSAAAGCTSRWCVTSASGGPRTAARRLHHRAKTSRPTSKKHAEVQIQSQVRRACFQAPEGEAEPWSRCSAFSVLARPHCCIVGKCCGWPIKGAVTAIRTPPCGKQRQQQ
eukprot:COSAG01_NODE_1516_length_10050_cov_7.042910_3_plen_151_part_00